jgi:hypothetical protein
MKPIEFREANVVFAKDQPEYLPLPVYMDESDPKGRVISCWKLSLWECFTVFVTGRLWLSVLTFNKPLQPQKPTVECPFRRRSEKS